MTPTSMNCRPIATHLTQLRSLLSDLENEYTESRGERKTELFYEIRSVRQQISSAEIDLDNCIHPPVLLPDLSATDFVIRWHRDRQHFDFAVLMHNSGAPVSGPFKITLGVSYYVYTQDPPLYKSVAQDFIFPSHFWINTNDTVPSNYWTDVPFVTKPGSSSASYRFDAIVDADDQIMESNKDNNQTTLTKLLKVPKIVLPPVLPPRAF